MSLTLNSFRRAITGSSSLRIASRRYSAVASSDASASPQPPAEAKASAVPSTSALDFTSSCTEGTPLAGLGLLKDTPDPIAQPDTAYPSWLWELHSAGAGGDAVAGASAGMTKGEQRAALKRASKLKRLAADKAAKSDLPDAQQPQAEVDVKRQLRKQNREGIKAKNFIKTT